MVIVIFLFITSFLHHLLGAAGCHLHPGIDWGRMSMDYPSISHHGASSRDLQTPIMQEDSIQEVKLCNEGVMFLVDTKSSAKTGQSH